MNWYLEVWRKFADFNGRARRKEYWFFVLFNAIITIVLEIIDFIVFVSHFGNFWILSTIYGLAVFIPGLAVTVRRLHDTNRSGWWLLLPILTSVFYIITVSVFIAQTGMRGEPSTGAALVMGIGAILLFASFITIFVFTLLDGTPGPNRYGPDPKTLPEPPGFGGSSAAPRQMHTPHPSTPPNRAPAAPQGGQQSLMLRGVTPLATPITLFPNQETVVGRSSKANVVIDNSFISGQHLSLRLSPNGELTVKDLGSTNGTYIDGQKLEAHVPTPLRAGQKLIIGSEDIVYER